MKWLEGELEVLKAQNLYRKRYQREMFKDFCSNDYLALRYHPEVIEASIKVMEKYGLGSGASALVSGYTEHHRKLEELIAEFKGVPCCVLFGSGYLANLGTIPSLVSDGDLILSDELNHASIIDACRLSKAKVIVYSHRDYEKLNQLLKENRKAYRRCLVVSDTVFSMDGDVADIGLLKKLSINYDCMLYLDEAHATGVLGKTGRGGLEANGVEWEDFMVIMGTLSKALGSYGAFVCGSKLFCEFLVNRARSLIFSTSLPPSVCAGASQAIYVLRRENWRIDRLKDMSSKLFESLKSLGFEVHYHGTPILPIILYDEGKAVEFRDALLREGILLQAIRYPTVAKGKARLRLTASLNYSEEDIEVLVRTLRNLTPSIFPAHSYPEM